MRTAWLLAMALLVCGCGGQPTAGEPAATSSAAAAALVDIPRTSGRAADADVDMSALEPFTGDLDALVERGVIRVLAAESATHYEVQNATARGRTVDAVIAFEEFVNKRIAPRRIAIRLVMTTETAIVEDVISGRGDIGANVLRTFERDERVAFASPVRADVREIVVSGPGTPPLVSLEDVGGRAIHVRGNSDHHASLVRLNEQLKKINRPPARIVIEDHDRTDERLLDLVNEGKLPATLVDDYVYNARRRQLDKTTVNADVAVSQGGELSWVTRREATHLLALINEFFATHRLTF